MKLLVLGTREVHALLPYGECIAAMRGALAAYAGGQVHQPLRTIIRPPGAAGMMALMPAYLAAGDAAGDEAAAAYSLKAICIFGGNPASGLDSHQGVVLLSSAQTGEPLALLLDATAEFGRAANVHDRADVAEPLGDDRIGGDGADIGGYGLARRVRHAARAEDAADAFER